MAKFEIAGATTVIEMHSVLRRAGNVLLEGTPLNSIRLSLESANVDPLRFVVARAPTSVAFA